VYSRQKYPRAVLGIDNVRWHRGKPLDEARRDNPHLEFNRLASHNPQWNQVERLWKKLRRRATHNRLFDPLAGLKMSLRASLCYFQTMRLKVKSVVLGRPSMKTTP
jgi:transposase